MKSRISGIIWVLAMLFCLSGLCLAQQGSLPAPPPTAAEKLAAEKAWESLIQAKGGREKLHSITNMLYVRSDYGEWTRLYVFPNSQWEYGVGLAPKSDDRDLQIFDGASLTFYWLDLFEIKSQSKSSLQASLDNAALEQLPLLLETKWFKPELLRVVQEKDGKKLLNVVETVIAKQRYDFVYDPAELLVSEVRWLDSDGSIFSKQRFSDYVDVDGVKMPRKISEGFSHIRKFKGLKDFVEARFSFNVKYVPDLFSDPKPAYNNDAWRRRSQHTPVSSR